MECDCPKTWSASVTTSSGSGKTINYTIQYNNPCGSEKTSRMTIGYKKTNGQWEYETRIVPIPSGSGLSLDLQQPTTGYHLELMLIMRMVKEVDLVDNKKRRGLYSLSFLLRLDESKIFPPSMIQYPTNMSGT